MNNNGKIAAISISSKKGVPKQNIDEAEIIADKGIRDDAHAGDWHRQISLLALEDIDKFNKEGDLKVKVEPGRLAENITTQNINLASVKVGALLAIGDNILLEVTQIGKVCRRPCSIYHLLGDCLMPRAGIFAKVVKGGRIKVDDTIKIIKTEHKNTAI